MSNPKYLTRAEIIAATGVCLSSITQRGKKGMPSRLREDGKIVAHRDGFAYLSPCEPQAGDNEDRLADGCRRRHLGRGRGNEMSIHRPGPYGSGRWAWWGRCVRSPCGPARLHRYVHLVTSSGPRASAAQIRVRRTLVERVGAEFEVATGSGPQENWTALAPGEPAVSGSVVYLDLNHWVSLSGARAGLPRFAGSVAVYNKLRSMAASGRITIVLCGALYREVAKIGPFDRRVRLADVMGELTSFRSVASMTALVPMEFAAALNRAIGRPMFPRRVPVFGVGAGFAFGFPELQVTLSVPVGAGLQRDEPLAAFEGATLDEVEIESRLLTEYGILRGPGAVAPPGFDPGSLRAMDAARLARELELRDNLVKDPVWRERLDDIVAARCLYAELGDQLPGLLDQAGLTVDGFFDRGKDFVTRIIDDVPVLATENLLRERNHRDFNRTFKGNDIYDSDALRVAVPYCDVVVTDRDAAAAVKSTGAASRYGTVVLASLDQLVEHLEASPAP